MVGKVLCEGQPQRISRQPRLVEFDRGARAGKDHAPRIDNRLDLRCGQRLELGDLLVKLRHQFVVPIRIAGESFSFLI